MAVVLGINAYHAGAAAAVLVDGRPVAAIAEERLNRVKYYARFPGGAIRQCLEIAGLSFGDIDAVAVGRDPSANRRQKIAYALRNPRRLLNFVRLRKSRSALDDLKTQIARHATSIPAKLRFAQHDVEHHVAHTASAYFISRLGARGGLHGGRLGRLRDVHDERVRGRPDHASSAASTCRTHSARSTR